MIRRDIKGRWVRDYEGLRAFVTKFDRDAHVLTESNIASMNDKGASFAEIADYIEREL